MKRQFFFIFCSIFILIIALVSYGTYLNQRGEIKIAERMSDKKIQLRGTKVEIRKINPIFSLDTMNIYSDKMADAVSLIDGRITSVDVNKNNRVVQGQKLFTVTNETYPIKIRQADIDILKIENEIIQSDNEIFKSETNLARAKNDFERYSRLIEQNAVSTEKFEEIEAIYNEAQVNLKNAHIQKNLLLAQRDYLIAQKDQILIENSYSDVTAPIDGEILILYKNKGSYVTAGTAMALIGDFRTLNFSIDVEDKFARNFKIGDVATLNFNRADFSKIYDTDYEAGNSDIEQKFTARIVEINPPTSISASMRKIFWEIDNSSGLLEPQNYNATILQMITPKNCLTVPISAMTSPAHNEVFIVNDEKIYRREVETGSDDGIFIEIIRGLQENDFVVTSGTDGLDDGMKIDFIIESSEEVG